MAKSELASDRLVKCTHDLYLRQSRELDRRFAELGMPRSQQVRAALDLYFGSFRIAYLAPTHSHHQPKKRDSDGEDK